MSSSINDKYLQKKPINIELMTGESLHLTYDKSTRLYTLFDTVCSYLKLTEHDMFGLCIYVDNFTRFLDLQDKVAKINFKLLRKKSGFFKTPSELSLTTRDSRDVSEPTRPSLYLRVHYYVRWHTLRERVTKHLYYEQLKANLLHYRILCSEEIYFQLAALALQADYGNLTSLHRAETGGSSTQRRAYFNPKSYFPHWLISRHGVNYLRQHVPTLHQSHTGMTRSEAEYRFVRLASASPSNVNMHLCRLLERGPFDRRDRRLDTPLWLGVSPAGVELHQERSQGFLAFLSTITWSQIGRLSFKKCRLLVTMKGGRLLVLEAASTSQAEHLFWLCERMHLFQTAAQMGAPYSPESMEQFDCRDYRESYVYTDEADLENHLRGTDSTRSSLSSSHLYPPPPPPYQGQQTTNRPLIGDNGLTVALSNASYTPTIDSYSMLSASSVLLQRADSESTYECEDRSLPRPPKLTNGQLTGHRQRQLMLEPVGVAAEGDSWRHGGSYLLPYTMEEHRPVSLGPSRNSSELSINHVAAAFTILKRQTSQPELPPPPPQHLHLQQASPVVAPPRLMRLRTPDHFSVSPSLDFPHPPAINELAETSLEEPVAVPHNNNNNNNNNWKTMDLTQLRISPSWENEELDHSSSSSQTSRDDPLTDCRHSLRTQNQQPHFARTRGLSHSDPQLCVRLPSSSTDSDSGSFDLQPSADTPAPTLLGLPTNPGTITFKSWRTDLNTTEAHSPSAGSFSTQPFSESKVFFSLGFLKKRPCLFNFSSPALNVISADDSHLESFTC